MDYKERQRIAKAKVKKDKPKYKSSFGQTQYTMASGTSGGVINKKVK